MIHLSEISSPSDYSKNLNLNANAATIKTRQTMLLVVDPCRHTDLRDTVVGQLGIPIGASLAEVQSHGRSVAED